jgi:hypothetical protein
VAPGASNGAWRPPSTLPPLYGPWIDQLLGGPIPAETNATCHDCAMCAGPERPDPHGPSVFFSRETKCCTYVPTLHNFQVGLMLRDDDPSFAVGRATVEARLAAHAAVSPAGIRPLPAQARLYRLGGASAFGRNLTLRCPHYLAAEDGRCGIWRYRNGICATWFCKHVRGPVGTRFWQALERLLTTVELQLARWCIDELALDYDAVARVFAADNRDGTLLFDGPQLDGVIDERAYQAVWGRWYGREREFFREAGDLVRGLTWPEVMAAVGAEARLLANLAVHRYQALTSDHVPDPLTVGRVTATPAKEGRVRVVADGVSESLDLPAELWAALPAFDGRPNQAVLRAISAGHRIDVQPSLVRKLVDFELLVPVAAAQGHEPRR